MTQILIFIQTNYYQKQLQNQIFKANHNPTSWEKWLPIYEWAQTRYLMIWEYTNYLLEKEIKNEIHRI